MAGELRTQNSALLIKIEVSEGVDAAPVAADAIRVENVNSGIGTRFIESTEITGSIDSGAPQVVGAPTSWTASMRLRGAVGAITSLNLPPADPVLRIAGYSSNFLSAVAAANIAAVSGALITLDATFSNVAQFYQGAPLILGGPNHANRVAAVLAYATSRIAEIAEVYSPVLSVSNTTALPACVVYRPISSGIPTATLYHYKDGILRKLLGARASISMTMDTGGFPVLNATFTGSFGGETDAAIPAGIAPNSIAAPLFLQSARNYQAFLLNRAPVGINNIGLDQGATLVSPPDPNTVNGFAGGVLTARDNRLTLDPNLQLVATRDIITPLLNGTQVPVVAHAGGVEGNRMMLSAWRAQIIAAPDGDREGIATRQLEMKLAGANAGHFISFF